MSQLSSGQMLGKYELRDMLGSGGMGAVYRAYDHTLSREVAVKVVHLVSGGADFQARFIREAKTAAGLEHSHIVRVYDYGIDRDINYVVMQNLTGGSLSDRIKQAVEQGRPRASLSEVARLLEQLAGALDYAHAQGVIHRDIKPQNVMFNNQGQAFIVDFGIAKLLNDATNLTGTNMAMGTPNYMPPEQWTKRDLTPAADQYALAVTMYQLVAGRLPFEADSVPSLWYKIENEQPTPLNTIRPDVPSSLILVMARALAKNPAERFPNCTQFAQAFASAVSAIQADSSNYFTFKLAKQQSGTPFTPASNPNPVITPANKTPPPAMPNEPTILLPASPTSPNRRGLIVSLIGAGMMLLLAAVIAFGGRGDSSAAEMTLTALGIAMIPDVTETAPSVLLSESNTPLPTLTDTQSPTETLPPPSPTPSSTPSETLSPTDTAIPPSETPTATATATDTPTYTAIPPTDTATVTRTPTVTPSHTASATTTHTPTATLSAREAAIATRDSGATQTATAWTPTPTLTNAHTPTPNATQILEKAAAGVTANADWTPVEREFDGVPMVLVPVGCFMMGSMTGESDETPVEQVCIEKPFWLDKTEVTQSQFTRNNGVKAIGNGFTGDNRPVEIIIWFEARGYCEARGGRLPTEAEWEFAARGPDGLAYPWGNLFIADNIVYGDNSNNQTAEVGSRPTGKSWVGALDMSGNVWEWTNSVYQSYPYHADDGREDLTATDLRVLRGGSWLGYDNNSRAAYRSVSSPDGNGFDIGFRCARS